MAFRFVLGLVAAWVCLHRVAVGQELALSVIEGDNDQELTVMVFIGNNTPTEYTPPKEIAAYLKQGSPYDFQAVTLEYAGPANPQLVPGSYGRFAYKLMLPDTLSQTYYQLGLEDQSAEPVYVQAPAVASVAEAPSSGAEELAISSSDSSKPGQTGGSVLSGVSTYKPIYFLFGGEPFDAKFQISLKYQLFNPKGAWAEKLPWLSGLHLGYTQVAFWDLAAESKPFEDTNFMPEVFYRVKDLKLGFLPDNSQLDVQGGVLHESNGRSGDDSRSLNIAYVRAIYDHSIDKDWFFKVTGDVWRYVGSLKDNPDIIDYRGHSSLGLTAGARKGVQFAAYRRGKIDNGKGSYLFDLTVPLKRIGKPQNLNFTLHGQLFTGYGENLLTYDQKETRFRLGLGIFR